jgi:A/G-specific adenine glycosylase
MSSIKKRQEELLSWYDRHQRVLPWRARQGQRPDPYHVWLSEIMLQQTTVVTVGAYFKKFLSLWPRVQDLAKADLDEVLAAWAGLGYYARARNLHKCAVIVTKEMKGKFPQTVHGLMELPGIGPYTAGAISSIAFDQPAVAVDGNVERVVSRVYKIETPLPQSKPEIYGKTAALAKGVTRPGDFTQAMMELGATVCTPRKPKCTICPWAKTCLARKAGTMEEYPRKLAKKKKPTLYGRVFWLADKDGSFLIHKRAGKGLYEGMYQLPTTEWIKSKEEVEALPLPFKKKVALKSLGAIVRHSFTHFDLVLEVWQGQGRPETLAGQEIWVSQKTMDLYALPTLMKKAIRLCMGDILTKKR